MKFATLSTFAAALVAVSGLVDAQTTNSKPTAPAKPKRFFDINSMTVTSPLFTPLIPLMRPGDKLEDYCNRFVSAENCQPYSTTSYANTCKNQYTSADGWRAAVSNLKVTMNTGCKNVIRSLMFQFLAKTHEVSEVYVNFLEKQGIMRMDKQNALKAAMVLARQHGFVIRWDKTKKTAKTTATVNVPASGIRSGVNPKTGKPAKFVKSSKSVKKPVKIGAKGKKRVVINRTN